MKLLYIIFFYQTLSLYELDNVLTTAATFQQNYAPLFHFIPGLRKELRDYLLAFKHSAIFLIGSYKIRQRHFWKFFFTCDCSKAILGIPLTHTHLHPLFPHPYLSIHESTTAFCSLSRNFIKVMEGWKPSKWEQQYQLFPVWGYVLVGWLSGTREPVL